jgi:hypothetical protein
MLKMQLPQPILKTSKEEMYLQLKFTSLLERSILQKKTALITTKMPRKLRLRCLKI